MQHGGQLTPSPGIDLKQLVRELYVSGLPLNAHSNGYENARLVKPGPGYLLGFTVYNSNVAAQFIQVHDKTVKPVTGDVPCFVFAIATISDREFYFNVPGRAFQHGIWIVNSTTGPTCTLGAADCFFDAQYI